MEIAFTANDEVRAAIARIGRTEDVQFSPDGRRLALAGFIRNRILIVDLAADFPAESPQIMLTGSLELDSPSLDAPHGLSWVDEQALVVANRGGGVAIFALPAPCAGSRRIRLKPVRCLGGDRRDLLAAPGSVSAASVGPGLVELLVCNNLLHQVSRHLLDQRDGYALVASEVLLEDGFDLPDGVAHSPSGRWIAVSNHRHHCVHVFRNDGDLNRSSKPQGVLRGIRYPHGLQFAADEMSLLVAGTGMPFVHHFRSDDRDWAGEREPSASIRVMGDDVFERGRFSPVEGGPKGIDVTRDGRLMVVSCEVQPLAFLDVSALLAQSDAAIAPRSDASEAEQVREVMLRYLAATGAEVPEPSEEAGRLWEREIRKLVNSRSYRITAPLRRIAATLRRPVRQSDADGDRPGPPSRS